MSKIKDTQRKLNTRSLMGKIRIMQKWSTHLNSIGKNNALYSSSPKTYENHSKYRHKVGPELILNLPLQQIVFLSTSCCMLNHELQICGPPGCIMWPVAIFANCVYTIKISQHFRQLDIPLTIIFHIWPANQPTITDAGSP